MLGGMQDWELRIPRLIDHAAREHGPREIVTHWADGTETRKLTATQAFDACPDIGPRGALIAFCSNRSGAFEIWLMDGTGGSQRQLTRLGGNSTFPDITGAALSRAWFMAVRSMGSADRSLPISLRCSGVCGSRYITVLYSSRGAAEASAN